MKLSEAAGTRASVEEADMRASDDAAGADNWGTTENDSQHTQERRAVRGSWICCWPLLWQWCDARTGDDWGSWGWGPENVLDWSWISCCWPLGKLGMRVMGRNLVRICSRPLKMRTGFVECWSWFKEMSVAIVSPNSVVGSMRKQQPTGPCLGQLILSSSMKGLDPDAGPHREIE